MHQQRLNTWNNCVLSWWLTELFQNKSLLEPFSQGLKKQDSLKYQNKHLLQGLLEVLLAQTNLKTIDPSDFPQQHPTHLQHLHPSPIHHWDDTSGKTGLWKTDYLCQGLVHPYPQSISKKCFMWMYYRKFVPSTMYPGDPLLPHLSLHNVPLWFCQWLTKWRWHQKASSWQWRELNFFQSDTICDRGFVR